MEVSEKKEPEIEQGGILRVETQLQIQPWIDPRLHVFQPDWRLLQPPRGFKEASVRVGGCPC